MTAFEEELSGELEELKKEGRFRSLREIRPLPHAKAELDGVVYSNFSGNDYMGVACDPDLRREFYDLYRADYGTDELAQSSASSRLLTGSTPAAMRLERTLSQLYGRSALVFNNGYHANLGILPALAGKKDLILSDKLNHASIIDGMKLSGVEFRRYRHCDLDNLETLLAAEREKYRRVFLVTESVFSMDGDAPDLVRLAALKKKYDAFLIVDEAHGVGVRGPEGRGLAAELGVDKDVDILIGTFGKAFGSTGAFAVMSEILRDYLVNRMRPLIFSTALPPVVLNWSDFVVRKLARRDADREKVARMGRRLRELFRNAGCGTGGDSQIVPLMAGSDPDALAAAEKFRKAGILVFAIRPPTVPPGTSRLRFSLSAGLDESIIEQIGRLL